ARLGLHIPQLQELGQRLAEARRGDNPLLVTRAYSELAAYQKRHDVNPLRGFLVPLVQTPLFISFFLALRGMASAPVPGLQRGGLAWFPDLCSPDPLYVLPLAVTASMWMVLELGAETGVSNPGTGTVRQILRLLPLIFLPFIIHFPTVRPQWMKCHPIGCWGDGMSPHWLLERAIFTYWLTSNTFSLVHTGVLRIPAVRRRLGIVNPPPAPAPNPSVPRKGLLGQLKQEWKEAQALQRGEERQRRMRQQLQEAARGPLRQTFTHNPLAPPGGANPAPPPLPKRPWKETLG
ncbi:OXA1L protein, partial [Rhinopomastus cyanomelas]|nr:OXA1L protein [Rhinopomastus cyanomelas]